MAGVLYGYPAGIALNLFFFGYEIGPAFAARAHLFLIGLVAQPRRLCTSTMLRPQGAGHAALQPHRRSLCRVLAVIWIIRQAPIGVIMATVVAVSSAIPVSPSLPAPFLIW